LPLVLLALISTGEWLACSSFAIYFSYLMNRKLKIVSVITIAIGFALNSAWALNVSLDAKTLNWGKRDERSRTSDGFNVTTTKQSRAVEARVHFFEKPKESCIVQCFFFAKDVETKDMFLFYKEEKPLTDNGTLVFEAPEIINGVRATRFSTANVWLVGGGSELGTLTEHFSSSGSRFHGWVVRVIFDGKVDKVEANQSDLLAMGKTAPASNIEGVDATED
jgi:hypothetical protein